MPASAAPLPHRTERRSAAIELRAGCHGLPPLTARLEPWMEEVCHNPSLPDWVRQHGSPLNILSTHPMQRHVHSLQQLAATRQLDFRLFFARKANKCLSFIDAAQQLNCGVDVASPQELQQVLQRQFPTEHIICTAAIKNRELLATCAEAGVTVAIDNLDELQSLQTLVRTQTSIALRLSGFRYEGEKLFSRFGLDVDQVLQQIDDAGLNRSASRLSIDGIHFHLDGYVAGQRQAAIRQSLNIVDALAERGHQLRFLDMGGGFPMSYLQSAEEWETFWAEQHQALLGERSELTYRNHSLGQRVVGEQIVGKANVYPYYQQPVQADWLAGVLDSPGEDGDASLADAIRRRGLQLRCEPGRSVLDGCGMTVARVEYRKQHPAGHWLIGLAMNHTQCRTSSDDFLVDPLHVPVSHANGTAMEGYLVGAYCTESELLLLRRLRFPHGITVGDLIVFPNTAGYLMHFRESRSHQFPLAKNVFVDQADSSPRLDGIDH